MKKSMILLGAVSALSLMAISCQKEASNVEEPSGKVHMTIIASGDAETRTVLQADGKTVLWDNEENLAVLETIVGAEETNTTYVASSNGVSNDGGETMTFDVEFDTNVTGTSYTYNALYPNSSYVTSSNTNPEAFKVITPTTQKATATSFDGDADLLIAKPATETTQQTTLNLCFKRMVVVGKMTLNNVQTDGFVKSVKFSSADKVITGKSKLNLTTGEAVEYGYEGTGNRVDYVEVTYAANDIPANGLTVYFTCLPFEIAAGEKFTVTLTTKDDKTFTREVTIPEGRKLSFAIGKNTKFSVDMTEATSGENESLADKDYVIVGRYADKNGVVSGNYAYMTSTLSSTSTKYYIYGTTSVSATDEIDVTNSKVDFPDVTDYWTIEAKGDNYAIKSKKTGKYVSWTSGNSAAQSDSPYELKISAIDDIPGMYKVSSIADPTRFLQYNGNSGQQRFAFYTGTQNDIFLIPVGADVAHAALESIAVSDVETTVFYTGDTFAFDGKVIATYDDESTKDVTAKATVTAPDMTTAGTKAVTVSYTEGEVTKTTTYDITVNAKPVIKFETTTKNVRFGEVHGVLEYSIENSIDGNLEASCESDSDWLVAESFYLSGTTSYEYWHTEANDGAERTGHLTFTYPHAEPVVITFIQEKAEGYEPDESWVEVTSLSDVTAGEYVIAWVPTGNEIDDYYFLPSGTSYTKNPVAGSGITVANGVITSEVSKTMKWTFTGNNTDGFTVSDGTYYLASTNAAQGISIVESTTIKWKASLSTNETYTGLLLRGSDGGSRNLAMMYPTSGNPTWRYYSAFGSGNYYGILHLFKKTSN